MVHVRVTSACNHILPRCNLFLPKPERIGTCDVSHIALGHEGEIPRN